MARLKEGTTGGREKKKEKHKRGTRIEALLQSPILVGQKEKEKKSFQNR